MHQVRAFYRPCPLPSLLDRLFGLEVAFHGLEQSRLIAFKGTEIVIAALHDHLTSFFGY